jgi:hypothetical protein
MSFERIDENDGAIQLDPLACLVYQMFSIFVHFCFSCHCYPVGKVLHFNNFPS